MSDYKQPEYFGNPQFASETRKEAAELEKAQFDNALDSAKEELRKAEEHQAKFAGDEMVDQEAVAEMVTKARQTYEATQEAWDKKYGASETNH